MAQFTIVGTTVRSRKGCLNCRRKKKKCDEHHPVCGGCLKRHLECTWRDRNAGGKLDFDRSNMQKSQRLITEVRKQSGVRRNGKRPHGIVFVNPKGGHLPKESKRILSVESLPDVRTSKIEDLNVDVDEEEDYAPMDESQLIDADGLSEPDTIALLKSKNIVSYLNPKIRTLFSTRDGLCSVTPSSFLFQHLDSTASMFLNHYMYYLARGTLNIGNDKFYLFALQLAQTSEAVLYSVVAWGGMFLMGQNSEVARSYYYKSLQMAQTRVEQADSLTRPLSNEDYLILLYQYTLLMAAEISTGDVREWFQLHLRNCHLLSSYGGVRKFLIDNKNMEGTQWVVSNICYHDVVASRPLDFGTVIELSEYEDILDSWEGVSSDAGIDPIQGLCQGLYFILGETINKRRQLKNELFQIHALREAGESAESIAPLEDLYNKSLEDAFAGFESRIVNSVPSRERTQKMVKAGHFKLLEMHLTLFELVQYSLQVWIRINLKELSFTDREIQSIKSKADRLFMVLIGTRLQTLLCLPILMFGLTCVYPEQRRWMGQYCQTLMAGYAVQNVHRCCEVVQEGWRMLDAKHARGERYYIDWSEIVSDLGWNVCFS